MPLVSSGQVLSGQNETGAAWGVVSGGLAEDDVFGGYDPETSGSLEVYAGGVASGCTVNDDITAEQGLGSQGPVFVVDAGGSAVNTVLSAVTPFVFATIYGETTGTTVEADFMVEVGAGGLTVSSLVEGLSEEVVLSGGVASGATLQDEGALIISGGGSAVDVALNNECNETVENGGFLSLGVLSGTAQAIISSGGVADELTISTGAVISVLGAASGLVLAGGTIQVEGGGVVSTTTGTGTIIYDGGTFSGRMPVKPGVDYEVDATAVFYLSAGAVVSGVTLQGELIVSGTASNTVLDYGVLDEVGGGVLVGASGTGTIVYGSGLVLSGATLDAAHVVLEIGSGGVLDDSDLTAPSTLIIADGGVMSGGTVEGALIDYGVVSDVTIDGPAPAIISADGTLYGTGTFDGGDVASGATLIVEGAYSREVASGATVEGTMIVYGSAVNTILDGGVLVQSGVGVLDGLSGSGTIVYDVDLSNASLNSPDVLFEVGSGFTFFGGDVTSVSTLILESGASGRTISVEGELIVASGATIFNDGLTLNGGEAIIGGAVSGGQAVTFSGSGGHLVIDDVATFGAVISGFSTSGQEIDLGGFTYSAGETVTWTEAAVNTSGTLTVSGAGMTATLTLLGDYATSNFSLSDDGVGGAFITDPAGGGGGAVAAGHSTAASSPIIGGHVASFAQAMAAFSEPLAHVGWIASTPGFGFGQAGSALTFGAAISGAG